MNEPVSVASFITTYLGWKVITYSNEVAEFKKPRSKPKLTIKMAASLTIHMNMPAMPAMPGSLPGPKQPGKKPGFIIVIATPFFDFQNYPTKNGI